MTATETGLPPGLTPGQRRYLTRGTPVTDAVRATLGDPTAMQTALAAVKFAPVPAPTVDQLMGRDGGEWVADTEFEPPAPGTWGEVLQGECRGLVPREVVTALLGGDPTPPPLPDPRKLAPYDGDW